VALQIVPDRHGKQYGEKFFLVKGNRLVGGELCDRRASVGWFVSDVARRRIGIACPRCQTSMREIMRIAPLRNEPGLIAYECPACEKLTVPARPASG
jgi:hypothetical protein